MLPQHYTSARQSILLLLCQAVSKSSVHVCIFSHAVASVCLPTRMAQWGAVFSIIAALGGAALLASVHKIDEGHTGVYYRWAPSGPFLSAAREISVKLFFIHLQRRWTSALKALSNLSGTITTVNNWLTEDHSFWTFRGAQINSYFLLMEIFTCKSGRISWIPRVSCFLSFCHLN